MVVAATPLFLNYIRSSWTRPVKNNYFQIYWTIVLCTACSVCNNSVSYRHKIDVQLFRKYVCRWVSFSYIYIFYWNDCNVDHVIIREVLHVTWVSIIKLLTSLSLVLFVIVLLSLLSWPPWTTWCVTWFYCWRWLIGCLTAHQNVRRVVIWCRQWPKMIHRSTFLDMGTNVQR